MIYSELHPRDLSVVGDELAILASISNIFGIAIGERPMLRSFGCRLNRYLFEPIDDITAQKIMLELRYALTKWEDRVEIEIAVEPHPEESSFLITFRYRFRGIALAESKELRFYIEAGKSVSQQLALESIR